MAKEKGEIIKNKYNGSLEGARFTFAGMNFMVDPADLSIEDGQMVDICNCDVDIKNNVSRRDGYTNILQGANVHSVWSNNTYIYLVYNGILCSAAVQMNLTPPQVNLTSIVGVPNMNNPTEFKQVNDVVVFSDGTTMGVLEGLTATIISKSYFEL